MAQRVAQMKLSAPEFAYLKLIAFTAHDLPQNPAACFGSAAAAHCSRQLNAQACQELFDHLLGAQSAALHELADSQSENGSSAATSTSVHSNLSQLLGQSTNSLLPTLHSTLERYSQLMQLLSPLRWFDTDLMVQLFFGGVIGALPFESVMPVILNMDVMNIFDTIHTAHLLKEEEERPAQAERAAAAR